MKKLHILILLCGILFMTGSCTKKAAENDEYTQSILRQMEQAESSMNSKDYEKAFQISKDLLSSFKETQNNDSVETYSLKTLDLFYSACLKQKKLQQGLDILDKFYANQQLFINKYCRHELLATSANLYQMTGQCEKAISRANEYLKLPAPANSDRLIQTLEMISGVYYYCDRNMAKAINLLEKASDAYHRDGTFKSMGRVLSRLASYYRETGNYEKAVQASLEAIKFYDTHPYNVNIIIAYGELANTYKELNMYDKALQINSQALYYARKDSFGIGDLYRMRSDIFVEINNIDSVFFYLRKGEEASLAQKSFKGVFINKLDEINILLQFPDSLNKASSTATELCTDSARIPQWAQLRLHLYIGYILKKSGKPEQGLQMIEKAVTQFSEMAAPDMEMSSLKFLMDEYIEKGAKDKLFNNYARYNLLRDSLSKTDNLRTAAALNIKFDTERKEKEIQLLSTRIELKNKSLLYNIGLCITLFLLLIAAISYILMRRKSNRLIIEANKRALQGVLMRQQELNKKNELLTQEIQKALTTNDTESVLKLSRQNLLSREDEVEFRQAFNTLYPHYLNSLRDTYLMLTRTEELLAMLIVLNHTTDEIALIMGINHTSVNITRSRMRKKMELEKNDSLNEILLRHK